MRGKSRAQLGPLNFLKIALLDGWLQSIQQFSRLFGQHFEISPVPMAASSAIQVFKS